MYIANQIIPKPLSLEIANIYVTMQEHGCLRQHLLEQDGIVALLKTARSSPFPKVREAFTRLENATRQEGMLHLFRRTGILPSLQDPKKTYGKVFEQPFANKKKDLQCDYDICSVA